MKLRRRFDTSLEELWDACSDRDRLRNWFGRVSGELREGATLTLDIGMPGAVTCRVFRCVRPRGLLLSWAYGDRAEHPDEVELRLEQDQEGTLLEIEHFSDDPVHGGSVWFGVGPGWEQWIFRLDVMLRGGDLTRIPSGQLEAGLAERWADVVSRRRV